jgi:Zn-dependent peptidase ImmA (M78 family)
MPAIEDEEARRLLLRLGMTAPELIDVETVAKELGAMLRFRPLDNCAAFIVGRNERAVIVVDERSGMERRRFSVAHEIGHWIFDRSESAGSLSCDAHDMREFGVPGTREARANRFAANLLMPSFLFGPASVGRPITFETVADLAEQFRTSRTSVAVRLVKRSPRPAILVYSNVSNPGWSISAPNTPPSASKAAANIGAVAYDLMQGRRHAPGPIEVNARCWFDEGNGKVWEQSIETGRGHVLTILSWGIAPL